MPGYVTMPSASSKPEPRPRKRLVRDGEEKEQSRAKRVKKEKTTSSDNKDLKEMWDTLTGDNSNAGVNPSEDEAVKKEIDELFNLGKKNKKKERSPAETAMLVENYMAEFEVTAEEDAELNRQGKPAVNKLKKASLLREVLSKKQLQEEFLDHGVLALLKLWLEPLPDGSLPNIYIREAILKILRDYPLDLGQCDRRDQLKKSGLGKVIMFLSRYDEETSSNKKLAKEIVEKWSRPLFSKSTRFDDMRNAEEERVHFTRPSISSVKKSSVDSKNGDLELDVFSRERKPVKSSSSRVTSRPEAMQMSFVVRPESKIDPYEVLTRAKQAIPSKCRININKKLQQLKTAKKKPLQALTPNTEGRRMVNYS